MSKIVIKRIFSLAITLILSIAPLSISAMSCSPEYTDAGKIIVAVSILPQVGFVEVIGGDWVDIVVMVPPGASPHTYEVTPDQMIQLSKAKIYAKVGSPVEFELAWMDKLIAVNKDMLVVDCSKDIQLMEMAEEEHGNEPEVEVESGHGHIGLDPHIWLSVKNVKIMVQNICEGLVQVDPANKTYYEKNCADYTHILTDMDSELADDLSSVTNRSFIVFHPSFGYFARDYDLIQIAVEQGGKEPEADYIIRLIEEAREHDIKVIFVSPQYSTKSAEIIAKEIGGKVVVIDPLAKDFIENMRSIETAMKQAMQ
jgi:zinc transport system substrate-binding protein